MGLFDRNTNDEGHGPAAPVGVHDAVLDGLVDLGFRASTFTQDGKTETRLRHEIALVFRLWLLPGEPVLVVPCTFAFDPKSTLGRFMNGWRGRALGPNEMDLLSGYLGKAAMVSVIHRPAQKSGKPYAVVTAVMPASGRPVTAPRKPTCFEIGSGPIPTEFDTWPYVYGMPMRQYIESSAEWQAKLRKTDIPGNPPPVNPAPGGTDTSVPF
jgi:hypothetical protein